MRFVLVLTGLLIPLAAMAADPPVPAQKTVTLEKAEEQLKQGKKAEKELRKEMDSLKKKMGSTSGDLVRVAKDIKASEQELFELEKSIAGLEKEKEEIQTRLTGDKHSMGDLILALQRLSRIPPETLLVRPGAPLEIAQSALLLQTILPKIRERADALSLDLSRLQDVIEQLDRDRDRTAEKVKHLESRQAEISDLLHERKKALDFTSGEHKRQAQEVAAIGMTVSTLRELVGKIEENERKSRSGVRGARLRIPEDLPKAGSAQLPVAGTIMVNYGETNDIGAKSSGLTIEVRPASLVVAPMGGIVRYAGIFKNYGKLVIIEHENNLHSLIAGLERIDTVVGQSVSAGEPVGQMQGAGSSSPSLYYELRQDGQPVNPARKLPGLG